MRAPRYDKLPMAEQILIQKVEESIEESLIDSVWSRYFWGFGIAEENGRLPLRKYGS